MSELLGITVADLTGTMKDRKVRIPSEIGAFIALEVCEALLDGPASVKASDVRIGDDGSISVFAPPGSATSEDAARSVVTLLGGLLVAAGTGVPRVLVGLMEGGPSSGRWDLSSLRDDLEASLVPLNRAAARRVLSRMLREAQKSRASEPVSRPPPAARPPRDETLDDQLDDLLGGPPKTFGSERASARPTSSDVDAELDATIDELSMPSAARVEAARRHEPPVEGSDRTLMDGSPPSMDDEDMLMGVPRRRARSDAPTGSAPLADRPAPRADLDLDALSDALDAKARKSNPLPWVLAFVAILAATAAALALMRPDLVDAVLGRPPAPPEPTGPTPEEQARALREHRGQWGTLTIRANPGESQVLMRIGPGPAVADELPVGVAHEFVVIAEGRRPTRAVVPPGAEWPAAEGSPRYELAVQAGDDEMEEDALDLGPTRLTPDVGAPSGAFGSVRVITNPPGAQVYLLIGFSPVVTIENMRTDEPVELLVYHEGFPVARETVAPSAWETDADGAKHARITIVLPGSSEEFPEDE
jgi:hypothetical protein